MKKLFFLKWLNIILAVIFFLQVGTVFFRPMIPGKLFFPVHAWVGRTLILAVIVHILMNWGWIKTNILKK